MFREPGEEDGPGESRDSRGDAGGSNDSGRILCLMLDTRLKTPYANVSYRFVITSSCKMSTDLLQFARFGLCNTIDCFFVK